MKLSMVNALIAIFSTTALMFLLRAFPFIIFGKRKPPKLLSFIEKYIPPMVIGVLLVYCLNDPKFITVSSSPWSIPAAAGILFTVVAHIWKKNSMISIFGGTAVYMILNYIIV